MVPGLHLEVREVMSRSKSVKGNNYEKQHQEVGLNASRYGRGVWSRGHMQRKRCMGWLNLAVSSLNKVQDGEIK